ncbi:TolC family protein [Urechidicola croceus]|uniref:Transporter n=1 Tax=Urechidicola croceus TaxID=1850246 RepID=A0A1D8P8F0_9FLAO|nr:TolC family protein [Urechidicola croceus]AOW20843.1 transporter [Urechidicola croceus]
MRTKFLVVLAFIFCLSSNAQTKTWSLQECVDYAIENNITVKQSELDTEIAQENIVSAKGNFLPTVNGSTSGSFNFGSFIGQDGSRVSFDSFGNSLGLNAGVSLFNGYRNTNLYKQAQLGLESSELQLQKLKDDISLFVVNTYLNVLLNKENLKIADEQIKISQKQVEQIQELVDAGVRAKTDLYDIQAQLASDQERVVNAQNSIDLALLNLAQLLQVSHKGFDVETVELDLPAVALLYNDADEIFNRAVSARPEIRSAELAIENSELDIEIAKSAFYPSVSLGGGVSTSYQHTLGEKDRRTVVDPITGEVTSVANGFGQQFSDNLGYNIGVSVSIPIFNGGRTKSNVNRATLNNERIAYGLEQAKQDLRSTIEQAYADAKATLNQFEASQASVIAQEEAFRTAQESYDLGVMTSFEFEQVRNRLINAQASLATAKYNFVFKSKLLEFYYGIPITID